MNPGSWRSSSWRSSFWCSGHAAVAVVAVGAFVAWHLAAPLPFGDRDDANVGFLLTTGWFAVAAYVVLALYAARRAAHRLRMTPEFGWRVPLPELERAQCELTELQNRVARREFGGSTNVRRAAQQILARHGVQRVLRVDVAPDPDTLGQLRLSVLPREALGRLAAWLSAHVWYGIAAALLVWFHGGMRTGSTMGLALNALSYFVIGSGLVGALFWTVGPAMLTRAERELSIEKAFALRDHFARKVLLAEAAQASLPARRGDARGAIAAAEQKVASAEAAAQGGNDKQAAKAVKDAQKELKDARAAAQKLDDEAAALPRELAVLRGQEAGVRREAARLARYRLLLRGWRLVHVPCSVVLLALVAVHVLSIYYY